MSRCGDDRSAHDTAPLPNGHHHRSEAVVQRLPTARAVAREATALVFSSRPGQPPAARSQEAHSKVRYPGCSLGFHPVHTTCLISGQLVNHPDQLVGRAACTRDCSSSLQMLISLPPHRHYRSEEFAKTLLEIVKALQIPSWSTLTIDSTTLDIHKVSGSLTNDVFFISSPTTRPRTRTLLLRIYGPSSGNLISRPYELHILHALSARYGFGPTLYGTFENGRVEQYFDAAALTPPGLRDRSISRWIGARMAELHSVDVDVVEPQTHRVHTRGISVQRNLRSWLPVARDVLSLPVVSEPVRDALNLDAFAGEWDTYMRWLSRCESASTPSKRVFAHNDTQYGNLLKLNNPPPNTLPHRQVRIFIPLARYVVWHHIYPYPALARSS